MPRALALALALLGAAGCAVAPASPERAVQPDSRPAALPPLPDTSGWGVHVLAMERAPDGGFWVGTYGEGIFVLRPRTAEWESIRAAEAADALS